MTPSTPAAGPDQPVPPGPPVRHDGLLHDLTVAECWKVLSSNLVGRIGYVDGEGPVIVPLNYQVHAGKIWLRTASYNQLAVHLSGQRAAFEVDQIDPRTHTGHSVLVRGRAEHVLHDDVDAPPEWEQAVPWPDGTRTMLFCLDPDHVSGRSLRQRDVSPGAGHEPGSIQRSGPGPTGG